MSLIPKLDTCLDSDLIKDRVFPHAVLISVTHETELANRGVLCQGHAMGLESRRLERPATRSANVPSEVTAAYFSTAQMNA